MKNYKTHKLLIIMSARPQRWSFADGVVKYNIEPSSIEPFKMVVIDDHDLEGSDIGFWAENYSNRIIATSDEVESLEKNIPMIEIFDKKKFCARFIDGDIHGDVFDIKVEYREGELFISSNCIRCEIGNMNREFTAKLWVYLNGKGVKLGYVVNSSPDEQIIDKRDAEASDILKSIAEKYRNKESYISSKTVLVSTELLPENVFEVMFDDGHKVYLNKTTFEHNFRKITGLSFSFALDAIKSGMRVTRARWKDSTKYLSLDGFLNIIILTHDNEHSDYAVDMEDIMANDYCIVI